MLSPKQVGKVALVDDLGSGGAISVIGNIEQYRALSVSQTTAAQSLQLPDPADASVLIGIDVINSGSASFDLYGVELLPAHFARIMWDGAEWIPSAAITGELDMQGSKIVNLEDGVDLADAVNVSQLDELRNITHDIEVFVTKNGSDVTGNGSLLRPFASVGAAMAAITDAAPTKRYAIYLAAGRYTETNPLNLKANVFIIGLNQDAVGITAPSYGLDASFTGGDDNRAGISNCLVLGGASTFNFTTVTSTAGKLYFRNASFGSAVTLTGYNNATVQAQFSGCQMFGVFTIQGVNVGVFNDNFLFTNIVLNQSEFGGVPTILNATGGTAGNLTITAAVNDFNRRCSVFTHSMKFDGTVTVDGPAAYLDYTVSSMPSSGPVSVNGGNLVVADFSASANAANTALSNLAFPTAVNNPIMPANTNATNFGDWDKQWFWSFAYLHASTGTDCYLISYPSSFGAEASAGKNVYLIADGAGVAENINGGEIGAFTNSTSGTGNSGNIALNTGTAADGNSGSIALETGTVSGSGTRGIIELDGRLVDINSTRLINLADGVDATDAVNKGQLDAIAGAEQGRIANYKTPDGPEWVSIASTYVNLDASSFVGTYSEWAVPNAVNPNVIRRFALEAGKTYEFYAHIPLLRATNTGTQFRMYLVQFLEPASTEVDFENRLTSAVAVVNGTTGQQYQATLRTIYQPLADIEVAIFSSVSASGLEINTIHPMQVIVQQIAG